MCTGQTPRHPDIRNQPASPSASPASPAQPAGLAGHDTTRIQHTTRGNVIQGNLAPGLGWDQDRLRKPCADLWATAREGEKRRLLSQQFKSPGLRPKVQCSCPFRVCMSVCSRRASVQCATHHSSLVTVSASHSLTRDQTRQLRSGVHTVDRRGKRPCFGSSRGLLQAFSSASNRAQQSRGLC